MKYQLSVDDKLFIEKRSRIRRFESNWPVLHQGDEADAFFLVLEGEVEVSCQCLGKKTLLRRLEPGDSFGELGLLTGSPRSASVVAIKPSRFAVLSKQKFDACIRERPSLSSAIFKQMSLMVKELTEKLNVNAEVAYARLRYFLYELAKQENEGLVFRGWNHEELAQLSNCSRESITKMLGQLEQGGWIRRETNPKRIIIVKDLPTGY